MAVVDRIPLLLKCLFPPLFFLELLRHAVHKWLIVHTGRSHQQTCRHLLEPFYGQVREALAADKKLNPTVVEFGPGPYPSLEAYPSGTHLICVEPCTDFNELLHDNWNKSHLAKSGKLTLINSKIEDIDASLIKDNSVDLVLSRMVNCSVSDLDATFKTVHRVLKPGGRYYFWDHIRHDHNLMMKIWQYAMSLPFITYFTDGTPARKPFERLKAAGFVDVKANFFEAPMKMIFVTFSTPMAAGYASKE